MSWPIKAVVVQPLELMVQWQRVRQWARQRAPQQVQVWVYVLLVQPPQLGCVTQWVNWVRW